MAFRNVMLTVLAVALSLVVANSIDESADLPNVRKLPNLSRMLRRDPNPDPRCRRGVRNTRRRRVCCARGCTVCGGTRCSRAGGGRFCCGGRILASGRSCSRVGPPCVSSTSFPPSDRRTSRRDPSCRTGVLTRDRRICCPAGCRQCRQFRCRRRTPRGAIEGACCPNLWRRRSRTCNTAAPPCRVPPRDRPAPSEEEDRSRWVTITNSLTRRPTPRHEACMAWFGGKGYLIGGRGDRPLEIFDPAAETWTRGTGPGFVFHHMQCVGWGGKIWVASSWTGGFPREREVRDVWVYDIASDSWSTRRGLPARRLRGGAAQILFDDKIYVIGGNVGGHGAHARTLGWMDFFDLRTERWTTDLPNLPEGRDHVQGAVVNGNMLCVSGGRDGGVADFFTATITSTYCYTPRTRRWTNMNANLPGNGRGGITAVTTCKGEMMIAGGERLQGPASSQVDLFDGRRWRTTTPMNRGRHGGGLVVTDCRCGKIFAVSGSGGRGGGPELDITEEYRPNGRDVECRRF